MSQGPLPLMAYSWATGEVGVTDSPPVHQPATMKSAMRL